MGDSGPADDRTNVKVQRFPSTDRDGFLRRACNAYGREFKTEIDPADLQWALGTQCQRMGLEVGDRDGESSGPDALRCPFCDHEAIGSEMHTDETVDYLRRLVYREYILPQINNTFAGLEDAFPGGGDHSGGFLSIWFKFTHTRSLLPVRPIHGPEPVDMKIVAFLCCGKRIKVPEAWSAIEACCYCKTPVSMA